MLFFTSVFVLSVLILVFEVELFIDDPNIRAESVYLNVVYLVIITISSVGYGDISPESVPGKFVVMIMALWGAVLMAFVVNIVSNAFDLST